MHARINDLFQSTLLICLAALFGFAVLSDMHRAAPAADASQAHAHAVQVAMAGTAGRRG